MRTQTDQNTSLTSWTVPSTEAYSDTSTVTTEAGGGVLALAVTPRHDSIGIRCNVATTHVCINVTAADIDEEDRAAVDVVVALDISGSMLGDKLTKCKQTLEFMVRTFKSSDRFGLIIYSSKAKAAIPATKMTPENKEVALQKIKTLCATGQTNLSGGLALAVQEMKLIVDPNSFQTVFLLTDGHANIGITRSEELQAMVRGFTNSQQEDILPVQDELHDMTLKEETADATTLVNTKPNIISVQATSSAISLICFGYGSDHNSDMLSAIAKETPGGAYYFIDNQSESNVAFAFGEAMGGILSVVAQSTVLTVSLPPFASEKGIKIVKIHHDDIIARDGGSFSVNIDDFYAEESRDVLFEVLLTNVVHDNPCPHALVSISYFDVISGKHCTSNLVACNISRPESDSVSASNVHVEEQWTRIEAIQEINEAKREADANQFGAALERLRGFTERVLAKKTYLPADYVQEMVNDVEEVTRGLESRATYNEFGRHTMTNVSMMHATQRSMATSLPAVCAKMHPDSRRLRYSTRKRTARATEFQCKTKEHP